MRKITMFKGTSNDLWAILRSYVKCLEGNQSSVQHQSHHSDESIQKFRKEDQKNWSNTIFEHLNLRKVFGLHPSHPACAPGSLADKSCSWFL